MSLPATDSFTGTNGTELTTYSANWTYNNSGFTAQQMQIISNELAGKDGTAEIAAHWNADTFADDQYAKATITAIASGVYIGVAVRCASGSAQTFYDYMSDSGDGSYLDKYVAGTFTQLGSTGSVFTTSLAIELQASGTTITPKRGGATADIGAQTDSSLASGYAGVAVYSNGASRLDNWEGGNLGGGGSATLVADQGSFTESGQAIAFAISMPVQHGSFS